MVSGVSHLVREAYSQMAVITHASRGAWPPGLCAEKAFGWGGGMWKEVDAREPWVDGPGVGQSNASVSKDVFWENYSLAAFSSPEKAP